MISLTRNTKIAVVGLGYVGLPLAVAFAEKYRVIGYDLNKKRINSLLGFIDSTLQVSESELEKVICQSFDGVDSGLFVTSLEKDLNNVDIFVITVPTPVDKFKSPDLSNLFSACNLVGRKLKLNSLVIFESSVYPGCTDEECIPILECVSELKINIDFHVGYSPERINPGDRIHTLRSIKKVIAGSTLEITHIIEKLYNSIILAGTHIAPNIKVAEASKAIENAQRDLNISFVNELSLIFDRIGIDTSDVLEAAATKFNFMNFKPGFVGGHCISVDPYYLAHKSSQLGYHPQVILSGRRVNDFMATFVANKVVKIMIRKGMVIKGAKVLILGVTFKEDCPDFRNSKIVDILKELVQFGLDVDVYDPLANREDVLAEFDIPLLREIDFNRNYKAIILAVAHQIFKELDFSLFKKNNAIIYDAKSFIARELVDGRL